MAHVIPHRGVCRPNRSIISPVVRPTCALKTLGEIEAAICKGICQLQQDYMGRGPKDIRAHLVGDLLVVRLYGSLTTAEQKLAQTQAAGTGRDLLKQVRTQLIESAKSLMEALIREVMGVDVTSLHHDISTVSGEEVVVFSLSRTPEYRPSKTR